MWLHRTILGAVYNIILWSLVGAACYCFFFALVNRIIVSACIQYRDTHFGPYCTVCVGGVWVHMLFWSLLKVSSYGLTKTNYVHMGSARTVSTSNFQKLTNVSFEQYRWHRSFPWQCSICAGRSRFHLQNKPPPKKTPKKHPTIFLQAPQDEILNVKEVVVF